MGGQTAGFPGADRSFARGELEGGGPGFDHCAQGQGPGVRLCHAGKRFQAPDGGLIPGVQPFDQNRLFRLSRQASLLVPKGVCDL